MLNIYMYLLLFKYLTINAFRQVAKKKQIRAEPRRRKNLSPFEFPASVNKISARKNSVCHLSSSTPEEIVYVGNWISR